MGNGYRKPWKVHNPGMIANVDEGFGSDLIRPLLSKPWDEMYYDKGSSYISGLDTNYRWGKVNISYTPAQAKEFVDLLYKTVWEQHADKTGVKIDKTTPPTTESLRDLVKFKTKMKKVCFVAPALTVKTVSSLEINHSIQFVQPAITVLILKDGAIVMKIKGLTFWETQVLPYKRGSKTKSETETPAEESKDQNETCS